MSICPRLAVLALVAVLCGAARAEPLDIRIAWTNVPGQMTPVLFDLKSELRHYGSSYIVEHIHFAGSGPMVTGLATDTVDIAPLAPSSFGAALENARLDDLKIVSDDYQDGAAGHYSSEFLVLQDSAIHRIEDLKGKVIAVNAVGGGSDLALRVMLRQHALEDHRDYSVIETAFANMPATLYEHKVDLVSEVVPFALVMRNEGKSRALFTIGDAMGVTQSLSNVARAGFLQKNRAALVDFFEDYLRAQRWFLDPAHHREAADIIARFNRSAADVFAAYLFSKDDYYRDPNLAPDLGALSRNLASLRKIGFLKTQIDVQAHADLSFIAEAGKRVN